MKSKTAMPMDNRYLRPKDENDINVLHEFSKALSEAGINDTKIIFNPDSLNDKTIVPSMVSSLNVVANEIPIVQITALNRFMLGLLLEYEASKLELHEKYKNMPNELNEVKDASKTTFGKAVLENNLTHEIRAFLKNTENVELWIDAIKQKVIPFMVVNNIIQNFINIVVDAIDKMNSSKNLEQQ